LLCLFFDHGDGGEMFFRNVGWLSTDYTALYPRRQNSSEVSLMWVSQRKRPEWEPRCHIDYSVIWQRCIVGYVCKK
jgi:hypothetical protein